MYHPYGSMPTAEGTVTTRRTPKSYPKRSIIHRVTRLPSGYVKIAIEAMAQSKVRGFSLYKF